MNTRRVEHHSLDCNEGAIYNSGACTCACQSVVLRDKGPVLEIVHVCDVAGEHDTHECACCRETW